MEKIRIEVDKVILYYMDRVDPDGNLYRFYVYRDACYDNKRVRSLGYYKRKIR